MERNKEKIRIVIDTNILMSALIKDSAFTEKLLKSEFLDLYYPEDGLSITDNSESEELFVEMENGKLNVYEKIDESEIAAAYSLAAFEAKFLKMPKKANNLYTKALDIDPNNPSILSLYALYLHENNRNIEADKYYKRAIKAHEKVQDRSASTHNNYGVLLADLNRNKEAEAQYINAIEIDPKSDSAHNNYARLLEKLNRKSESEEHYIKAIEINPNDPSIHINYANFLREKDISEAEKEVRIALQIEPENPYAIKTLVDIFIDEDYFEEAKNEYLKALRSSSSMKDFAISEIHNNLGYAYAKLRKFDTASKEFKKAKNLDPLNVKAFSNFRAIRKETPEIEISTIQFLLGVVIITSLFISYYLFLNIMLLDTAFGTLSSFFIALLVFIFLYPQLDRFKAGPIEFEISTEYRFLKELNDHLEPNL